MSDSRNNVSARPGGSGEGYAPRYLAAKHRISTQQARDLLAEVGPDRERLDVVARVVRMASEG